MEKASSVCKEKSCLCRRFYSTRQRDIPEVCKKFEDIHGDKTTCFTYVAKQNVVTTPQRVFFHLRVTRASFTGIAISQAKRLWADFLTPANSPQKVFFKVSLRPLCMTMSGIGNRSISKDGENGF